MVSHAATTTCVQTCVCGRVFISLGYSFRSAVAGFYCVWFSFLRNSHTLSEVSALFDLPPAVFEGSGFGAPSPARVILYFLVKAVLVGMK